MHMSIHSPVTGNDRIFYHKMEKFKIRGKAIPLQAWTGPEGSRRLRLPDFKTTGT